MILFKKKRARVRTVVAPALAPEKEFMQIDGEKSRPIYTKTILPKSTEFMRAEK